MLEPTSSASRWSVPTLPVEQALEAAGAVFIDLRSPSEFAVDHIVGASSVPLFDDAQRALIGTLYRQVSPDAAFEAGRRHVEREIATLVTEIGRIAGVETSAVDLGERVRDMTSRGIDGFAAALMCERVVEPPPRAVVCYCWRGGLRSRSVVALLRALGIGRVVALEGGYRAYRAFVLRKLDEWDAPPCFVLRGLTGVGKTLVLRELEGQRPGWTIDLESMAGHRSSLLGMVGMQPRSQRAFESELCARVHRGFPAWMVVEGESRKVGDVILPRRMWRALSGGTSILLTAALERRVEVLIDDYLAKIENRAEIAAQLVPIQERLRSKDHELDLVRMLEEGRERELVPILLEHYYDPRYKHGEMGRVHALTLDATDPALAAAQIAAWIEQRWSESARARAGAVDGALERL